MKPNTGFHFYNEGGNADPRLLQGIVNSHNIDAEMVFISLPNKAKVDEYKDFVYDKSAGTGIMVYIVDTGADLRNDDVSSLIFENLQCLPNTGHRSSPNMFARMSDGFMPGVVFLRIRHKTTLRAWGTARASLQKLLAGNTAPQKGAIQL